MVGRISLHLLKVASICEHAVWSSDIDIHVGIHPSLELITQAKVLLDVGRQGSDQLRPDVPDVLC